MSSRTGWYPDPSGRFQERYFDGREWTDRVRVGDRATTDLVRMTTAPVHVGGDEPVTLMWRTTYALVPLWGLVAAIVYLNNGRSRAAGVALLSTLVGVVLWAAIVASATHGH